MTNNFILNSNGSCVPSTQTNCASLLNDGNCGFCAQNFYIDPNSSRCLAVTNQITNCAIYDSNQACLACSGANALVGTVCQPVSATITNCLQYAAPTICAICATGFAGSNCQAVTNQNCSRWSNVVCNACNTGFILNPNLYFKQNFALATPAAILTYRQSQIQKNSLFVTNSVCEQVTVLNCLKFATFNTCQICAFGFFLDINFQCAAFPAPSIANCAIYSAATTCASCISANIFTTVNVCTPIATANLVANCVLYNTALTSVVCLQCSQSTFLSSGTCTTRTNGAIKNCLTYPVSSDICSSCVTNFALTSDSLACLPVILNCAAYSTSTSSATALTCQTCSNGFFLQTTNSVISCVQGTVTNCLTYASSANTCTVCQPLFYITGTPATCVAHTVLNNCASYSPSVKNNCLQCQNGSELFSLQQICIVPSVIQNCRVFNPNGTCLACNNSFFLATDNSGTCQPIPSTFTNCIQFNNATGVNLPACTICASNFVLVGGNCFAPEIVSISNCDINNMPNTSNITTAVSLNFDSVNCNQCSQGTIPFNFKNYYICLLTANLPKRWTTTPAANCVRFDSSGNCQQCASSFFLLGVAPRTCGVCSTTYQVYTVSQQTPAGSTLPVYSIANFLDCTIADVTGVEAQVPSIEATPTLVNASCKTGYFMIIDNAFPAPFHIFTPNTIVNSVNYAVQRSVGSPVSYWPVVNCIQLTGSSVAINGVIPAVLITNCLYYVLTTTTNYQCQRCMNGFTGIVSSSTPSTNLSYLQNCSISISNCDNRTLQGFSAMWNSLTSCYTCSNSQIPQINYISSTKFFWSTTQIHSCAALPSSIDANCALVINETSSYSYCAVCNPMFTPVLVPVTSGSNANAVTCSSIQRCTVSTWFNHCQTCSTAFTYTVATGVINYNLCEATTPPANCYAASTVNGISTCYVCSPGFSFNFDRVCEQLDAPMCTTLSNSLNNNYTSLNALLFTFPSNLNGCNSCQANYSAVQVASNVSSFACLASSYVPPTTSINYIKNCRNYTINTTNNNQLVCAQCSINFIPTVSRIACVQQTGTFANCAISNDNTSICSQCSPKFTFAPNCVLGVITNCNVYGQSSTTVQQCSVCANGFYLSSNNTQCLQGSIQNCATYSTQGGSSTACTTCNPNFVLVSSANAIPYCYPLPSFLNMVSVDSTFGTQKNIVGSCNMSTFVPTTNIVFITNRTICLPFNVIPNCLTYDQQANISQSSYKCTACALSFFLNTLTNVCTIRTISVAGCSQLNPHADSCLACLPGRFLSTDFRSCIPFPTGIANCINYSNTTTCIGCNSQTFLGGNNCTAVTTAVANCLNYTTATNCAQCNNGFILGNNTCTTNTNSNCSSFTPEGLCASCNSGTIMSNNQQCMTYPDVNCVLVNNNPVNCLGCNSGFFLSQTGNCTAINSTITNCAVYNSANTCSQCNGGSVLSLNKTVCDSTATVTVILDPNCLNSQSSTPFCAQCNPGFFFQNSTCTSCPNTTSIAAGCAACNPLNTTSCVICSPGFFQNTTGVCITNSNTTATINQTNNTTGNSNITTNVSNSTTPATTGASLFSAVFSMFFVLVNLFSQFDI